MSWPKEGGNCSGVKQIHGFRVICIFPTSPDWFLTSPLKSNFPCAGITLEPAFTCCRATSFHGGLFCWRQILPPPYTPPLYQRRLRLFHPLPPKTSTRIRGTDLQSREDKMNRKGNHEGHRYVPSSFLSELSTQNHTLTSPRKGKQNQPSSA